MTDIARVFGASSDAMDYHLDLYANLITETDKTAVLADVDAHELIENDVEVVTAAAGGFKGNVSAFNKQAKIKKRIAGLIQWPYSSSGLVRG